MSHHEKQGCVKYFVDTGVTKVASVNRRQKSLMRIGKKKPRKLQNIDSKNNSKRCEQHGLSLKKPSIITRIKYLNPRLPIFV